MMMTYAFDRSVALERRIRQVNQRWTPEERQARRDLACRRLEDLAAALHGLKDSVSVGRAANLHSLSPDPNAEERYATEFVAGVDFQD